MLLIIGIRRANNPQYAESYYAAAIATLVVIGLYWVHFIFAHISKWWYAEISV